MDIALLLTGNELMTGDTVDSNSSYIAQSLKDLNLVPKIKQVVGDDFDLLVASIQDLSLKADVLVMNGGLGPTVDDLTSQALAEAAGIGIARHPDAMQHLQKWADKRGFEVTPSNLKQADLPVGCDVIPNPHGSAVGFALSINNCLVLCTPGVPSEFKPMVEDQILPRIRAKGHISAHSKITRIRIFGISESGLQDIIDREFPDWPENVELGFRVQLPVLELKVATLGESLSAENDKWAQKLRDRFADYYLGENNTSLPSAFNTTLLENGLSVVTAESCTGGLIASMITSEAGSSKVFKAGFVTYANEIKHSALGVQNSTLESHGAVCSETVLEMAHGALSRSGSEIAVAVSGVAGPDGGTEEKPVGTVFLAFGSAGDMRVRRLFMPVARGMFQRMIAAMALDLVRRFVKGLDTNVDYYQELRRKR